MLSAFPAFMGILTDEITEGEGFFVFFGCFFLSSAKGRRILLKRQRLCETFIKGEVYLKKQRLFMRVLMVTLPFSLKKKKRHRYSD